VTKGQTLLLLEAMKMEIRSPVAAGRRGQEIIRQAGPNSGREQMLVEIE
jgi:biotin carboxyl carrier protein